MDRVPEDSRASVRGHEIRHEKTRPRVVPTTSTEIMSVIRQITVMDTGVYYVSEKLKLKQNVPETEIREVLDGYEDLRDEVEVRINFIWEKFSRLLMPTTYKRW